MYSILHKIKLLYRIIFYVFLCVLIPFFSFAQKKLSIVKLPVEGLSNPAVNAIFQDHRGLLWFGTPEGLNRYDGYHYKIFKQDSENSSGLSGNYINTISADSLNRIWVGTKNGLNLFDEETNTFQNFFNDTLNARSIPSNNIEKIFLDSKKRLWVGSWGGLSLYNYKKNEFTHFKHNPKDQSSLSGNIITNITEDRKGRLWICTYFNGVNVFDPITAKVRRYVHDPKNLQSLSSNNVNEIYEDKSGNIWIGTHDRGLNKLNPEKNTFSHYFEDGTLYSIGTNSVYSIFENMNNELVVGGMHGGMSIYDERRNNFVQYDSYGNIKRGGNKASIFSNFKTKAGEVLVATSDGGVSIYDDYSNGFTFYKNEQSNEQSLSFNNVKHIYEDRSGNIWVGTDGGGLNLFDKRAGAFKRYGMPKDNASRSMDNTVHAVLEDSDGNLWFGSLLHGLALLDRKNDKVSNLQNIFPEVKLNSNFVHRLYEDKNKIIWIGNDKGVSAFDKKKKEILNYEKDLLQNLIGQVEIILEDNEKRLWIGSENGLYRKNHEGFEKIKIKSSQKKFPENYYVLNFYQDSKKNFWISTSEAGLGLIDGKTFQYTAVHPENDFFRENVTNLVEDNKKFLWVTSSKGLFKCSTQKNAPYLKVLNYYNAHDGLQGNLFTASTGIKTKTGELLFGGLNGFNIFHPEQLKINPHIPPLIISEFKIAGKQVNVVQKSIGDIKELNLTYEQNDFTIEFAALNFIKSNKNQYIYKLEGYDQDWIPSGTFRVATYNDVPPGDYVFHVKGSNNDGVWNEKGVKMQIYITNPFWRTYWFLALIILFIAALIYSVYRILLYKIPDKVEEFRQKLKFIVNEAIQKKDPAELDNKKELSQEQDELFMKKTVDLIEKHLSEPDFGTEIMCLELAVSRAQLYRKIKALTNKTVSEFIKHIRLERAKVMLENKNLKVSDVADLVGFKSLSHFSRSFQQEFGVSPSEFVSKPLKLAENE